MSLTTPHLSFPLRVRGGRFVAVEQDSRRHREDQAEVVLRTRPGTFDHDPALGLRDMLGESGPIDQTIVNAVTAVVDGDFEAVEASELRGRVRDVAVKLREGR